MAENKPVKRSRGRPPKIEGPVIPQQLMKIDKPLASDIDRLDWYKQKLTQIEQHIEAASSRDAAPLYNRASEFRDKIDEIREDRARASGKHLTPAQLREHLHAQFEQMADDLLEMAVTIYLDRNHCRIVPKEE